MTPASEQTRRDVEALLDAYRGAFRRYDLDAILEYYAFPCHFISDADPVALMPIATAADARAGVERVLAWHREIGMVSGAMQAFQLAELSPRLAVAQLDVEFKGAEAQRLYDFQGVYTLVKTAAGWRIAAIAHNQIPRLRACVAQAQSPAR